MGLGAASEEGISTPAPQSRRVCRGVWFAPRSPLGTKAPGVPSTRPFVREVAAGGEEEEREREKILFGARSRTRFPRRCRVGSSDEQG